MFAHAFRFDASRLHAVLTPRKPRHPLARIALGVLGLGVLALLVFFSVFVGIAMLAVGLVVRLIHARKPAISRTASSVQSAQVVDGEYRVVGKTALPSS